MSLFLSSLCNQKIVVENLPQMIPHYGFIADINMINIVADAIEKTETNGHFNLRSKTNNTLVFNFDTSNISELIFKNKDTQKEILVNGLKKMTIDEETGSSAYHVPHGILYRYGYNVKPIDKKYLDKNGFLPTDKIKAIIKENYLNED